MAGICSEHWIPPLYITSIGTHHSTIVDRFIWRNRVVDFRILVCRSLPALCGGGDVAAWLSRFDGLHKPKTARRRWAGSCRISSPYRLGRFHTDLLSFWAEVRRNQIVPSKNCPDSSPQASRVSGLSQPIGQSIRAATNNTPKFLSG